MDSIERAVTQKRLGDDMTGGWSEEHIASTKRLQDYMCQRHTVRSGIERIIPPCSRRRQPSACTLLARADMQCLTLVMQQ